jgi:hypothetical protein
MGSELGIYLVGSAAAVFLCRQMLERRAIANVDWLLFDAIFADGVGVAVSRQSEFWKRGWIHFTIFTLGLLEAWLLIVAACTEIAKFGFWMDCGLSVLIAVQLRNLQEITHYAVHGNVACGYGRYATLACNALSDLSFHYPALKGTARERHRAHVLEHHRNANKMGRDPNVDDLVAIGLMPGCSPWKFVGGLFWPLTIPALKEAMIDIAGLFNGASAGAVHGLAAATWIVLLPAAGGFWSVWFGFVMPRFLIYPLLSWWSQIVEHRWFASNPDERRIYREFEVGHRLNLRSLPGILLRTLVLPKGDYYHLAHSLFLSARWYELPMLDKILARRVPEYRKHEKTHLIYSQKHSRSVLGELKLTLAAPWLALHHAAPVKPGHDASI